MLVPDDPELDPLVVVVPSELEPSSTGVVVPVAAADVDPGATPVDPPPELEFAPVEPVPRPPSAGSEKHAERNTPASSTAATRQQTMRGRYHAGWEPALRRARSAGISAFTTNPI